MPTSTATRANTLLRYGGYVASVGTARILGVLISSVTFPILVRRLGVATYGIWSYVVAVCAFFEVVANPGLVTHITQLTAAHRQASADMIGDFLALRGLSVLIAALALLLTASFEGRADVRRLLLYYGLAALAVGLSASDFLLTSLELFHLRSALTLVQQGLYAAGVLLLVRTPRDILWLPASILGSSLVTNLGGWVGLWVNGFRPTWALHPKRWRGILVPSLHYAATTMLATVYHRTGHLVVRWLLGDYSLGLYAASVRLVDLLRNFVSVALGVLMPRMALAAQSRGGMRRLVSAAVSAVAALGIPLMVGTIATAHLVVPWVLGAGYANAVRPVRLLAPFLLAGPMASLFSGTILYAMGRHRAYLLSAVSGASTAVLLSLTLGHFYGLAGVCVAFVLAELAVALTALLLIPRDLQDLWKNPFMFVAAFSTLPMLIAIRAANAYMPRPLVVVAAGASIYLIAVAALGGKMLIRQFGEER